MNGWDLETHQTSLAALIGSAAEWASHYAAGWGPKRVTQPAWVEAIDAHRLPHGGTTLGLYYTFWTYYKPYWREDLQRWIWVCETPSTGSSYREAVARAHFEALYR